MILKLICLIRVLGILYYDRYYVIVCLDILIVNKNIVE